jgi:hypothetical protein
MAKGLDQLSDLYILNPDKTLKKTTNVLEWGQWMEESDKHVAEDWLTHLTYRVRVSTVFLGIDLSFTNSKQLFETVVFLDDKGVYTARYSSWEEADWGHKKIVDEIKEGRFKW